MNAHQFGSFVFGFEDVSPSLDLLPLAARRALDQSGLRLSLEGWQSLSVDDRVNLATAGTTDPVDAGVVIAIASRATPFPGTIAIPEEPSPDDPPAALVAVLAPHRVLDVAAWRALSGLERFALVHAERSARTRGDASRLTAAFDALVGPGALSGPIDSGIAETIQPPPSYVIMPPSMNPPAPAARPPASAPPLADRVPAALPPAWGPAVDSMPAALSSHLTPQGEARMVDLATKAPSARRAVATGSIHMNPQTVAKLVRQETPKGEVLATARIAGIMAAKRTFDLIPMCHPVALSSMQLNLEVDAAGGCVKVIAVAQAYDRTGVEMEAMMAVSVACLTVYDMLKGIDRGMTISGIQLLEKSGGRTGDYHRELP
jgi:cyclic pyranopterin phosphate synthase